MLVDYTKVQNIFIVCGKTDMRRGILGVSLIGCWAHLRRKFFEASGKEKTKDGKAEVGQGYCDKLFRLERELKELPPEERYEKRIEKAQPLVDEFWKWLNSFHAMKGKLQDAVNYAHNQKDALMSFLKDGRFAISNNLAL